MLPIPTVHPHRLLLLPKAGSNLQSSPDDEVCSLSERCCRYPQCILLLLFFFFPSQAQIVSPDLRMKSAVFLSASADTYSFSWSSTSSGLFDVRRLGRYKVKKLYQRDTQQDLQKADPLLEQTARNATEIYISLPQRRGGELWIDRDLLVRPSGHCERKSAVTVDTLTLT